MVRRNKGKAAHKKGNDQWEEAGRKEYDQNQYQSVDQGNNSGEETAFIQQEKENVQRDQQRVEQAGETPGNFLFHYFFRIPF
jgi:hypothetical protein